jgi:hypothetical protein
MTSFVITARSISGPRLKWTSVGSGFVRIEAVSIAQYQGLMRHSVEGLERVHHASGNTGFAPHSRQGHPASAGVSVLISPIDDGLWKTKASKSCSLASGRIPMGNQSAI